MYREIAAKTLTGKGKLAYYLEKELYLKDNVSKLLGCWIINLQHHCEHQNQEVRLHGSYSIQLWYAVDHDQKSSVYEEQILFDEKVMMSYRNLSTLNDDMYLKVLVSHYPTCIGMNLDEDGKITLKIESQFFVDAFQEAILVVQCSDKASDDLSLDEEILMNVNPNYLVNKKE